MATTCTPAAWKSGTYLQCQVQKWCPGYIRILGLIDGFFDFELRAWDGLKNLGARLC